MQASSAYATSATGRMLIANSQTICGVFLCGGAARALEGVWETAPVGLIEGDRLSVDAGVKDSWVPSWYYGSNVRPVAWARSREELIAAEEWFNEVGDLWLEDGGFAMLWLRT